MTRGLRVSPITKPSFLGGESDPITVDAVLFDLSVPIVATEIRSPVAKYRVIQY